MCRLIQMPRPTPLRYSWPSSAVCCSVRFRCARYCALIPGGSSVRAQSGFDSLRRFTLRDVLLGVQIAICAVLVTASLVALRGLARSLESNYGFQPQGALLVKTDLQMAGYDGDQRVQMQRHMLDAAAAIPGVTEVGYADRPQLSMAGAATHPFTTTTPRTTGRRTQLQMRSSSTSHRIISTLPEPQSWLAELLRCTMRARLPWSRSSIATLPAKYSGR